MMSAGAESVWSPDLHFLKAGHCEFTGGVHSDKVPVDWEFTQLKLPGMPLCYTSCTMHVFGLEATGLGDGFTFRTSAIRALAEAWERAWMRHVTRSSQGQVTSSNGFAAGRTTGDARAAALGELVERAAMLTSWREQIAWRTREARSTRARIVVQLLKSRDWEITFHLIGTVLNGQVLAVLARHKDLGAVFDSKFCGAGSSVTNTEIALIRSAMRFIAVRQVQGETGTVVLPEHGRPEDHLKFYGNPDNLPAFSAMIQDSDKDPQISLPSPDRVEIVNLTEVTAMPAVAHAFHPDWPEISWGRRSVKGKNPWPHPLA